MKKILTVLLCVAFVQKTYADCAAGKSRVDDLCDPARLQAPQAQLDATAAAVTNAQQNGNGPGIGSSALQAQSAGATAKAQNEIIVANCIRARSACAQSCKTEQDNQEAMMNHVAAEVAAENVKECKSEQSESGKTVRQGQLLSNNLGQTLLGLAALLASLGLGQGGDSPSKSNDCITNPSGAGCTVDTASNQPLPGTLVNGTGRESSSGGYDTASLNTSDVPATGKAADPSYASGTPGFGGGGGLPMVPSSAAGGNSRGKTVAEEPEGTPKINMPGGGAGGGRGGGVSTASAIGGKPGSGNPAASHTGIDGDKSLTAAAAEKALQVRGLASEGPLGGISSAHSLDNFQKVEKRFETERTQLSEL